MQNFIDLFGRVLIRVVGWGSPVTTVLRYLFPLLLPPSGDALGEHHWTHPPQRHPDEF